MLTEGKGESPSCEQSKKLTSLQRLRGNAGALINTEKKNTNFSQVYKLVMDTAGRILE